LTDEIKVGDLVRIVETNYLTIQPDGNAYPVVRIAQVEDQRPLYEVAVPNVFDEDTIPFWGSELEVVKVSQL